VHAGTFFPLAPENQVGGKSTVYYAIAAQGSAQSHSASEASHDGNTD